MLPKASHSPNLTTYAMSLDFLVIPAYSGPIYDMFYNDHNMALQIAPRLTTSNSTSTITTLAGGDAG
jgi:hypothetical protein